MEGIMAEIKNTMNKKGIWVACENPECGMVEQMAALPRKCKVCSCRVWPGDTKEVALGRATMASRSYGKTDGQSNKIPDTETGGSVEPMPTKTDPKKEETVAPTKTEPAKRQRKRRTKATVEDVGVLPTPEVIQDVSDPAEHRRLCMDALSQSLTTRYQFVGMGTVSQVGYTLWLEDADGRRTPRHRWYESMIEDGKDFMEELNQVKKMFPATSIDVARVIQLDDNIKGCAFKGEIAANLNAGEGAVRVKDGQRVMLGARLTGSGSIVWAIMPEEV